MAVGLKTLGIGAAVVAVCVGLGGYVYHDRYGRYFQDTNDATIQADQVAISSKLPGYVRAVPVADNQQVAAGALLVEIDPADYQTKLAMADADIASSVAAANLIRANREEAQAAVTEALAKLRITGTNLSYAQREVVRYGPLVSTGAEPAAVLSQLEANRDRASAEFAAARATVAQAQRRIASFGAQAGQNAAQAAAARVQREAAANDLSATRLVSPIAGRIAGRGVRVGQFVQPGTRAASPELARSADWQALRGAWRDAMAEAARAAGKQFQYLENEPQSAPAGSTLVVVQVKDYRYLSTGARYGLGVMTGNAYVNADAAFYVGPGRTAVGQRSYSTSSSAWQGIFSAMTDKQLAGISAAMLKDIDGG